MTRKHDTFLREGTDQITELNNALLALEEQPDDGAAMDRCFRCAHTLKSNFAAQGYPDASEIAHAMEDVLDDVREGELAVGADLMDQLFAGVDALESHLDAIDDGEEPPDGADELATGLRAWRADATTDDGTSGAAEGEADPPVPAGDGADAAGAGTLAGLRPALESGGIVRASVELAPSEVPGADGMLVLERLADEFDVVETDPATDVVHAGDHGGTVDVFVEEADEAAIRELLAGLQPVDAVSVTGIADVDFSSEIPAAGDADDGTAAPSPKDGADDAGTPAEDDPGADRDGGDAATSDPGLFARLRARLFGWPGVLAGMVTGRGSDDATPGGPPPGEPAADGAASTVDADSAADGGAAPGGATPDPAAETDGIAARDADAPTDGPGPGGATDGDDGSGPTDAASVDDISTVRVDVEQLDELYGLVERLVTNRIKLRNTLEEADVEPGRDIEELDKTTSTLQDTVMEMRLVPMKRIAGKFPRVVRDLAREQGKTVDLTMDGTDVELDRRILDRVSDPLVHLVRNAVDHGIEPPEEREAADKPREGVVELTARRERDTVVITIADDGRGIDPDELREAALERGIRTERELEAMDDDTVYDLVFHPGFSTSDEVTEVSGRGVGMDVVYNTVSRLDGSVSVASTPGEGTEVTLELPVSVAIVKVLFVRVDGDRFGVPIKKVSRVTHFEDVETVNGTELVDHDDGLTPVVRLHEALDTVSAAGPNGDGMLVHVQESERPIALYCDDIVDYQEVVVKPVDGVLSGTPGLSGTAVLGEGDVVPVLDVMTI